MFPLVLQRTPAQIPLKCMKVLWNISDHLLVGITFVDHYYVSKRVQFTGRTYRKYNTDLFKACMRNADWGPYDECDSVNARWEFILHLLHRELDIMCPVKVFKVQQDRAPQITH